MNSVPRRARAFAWSAPARTAGCRPTAVSACAPAPALSRRAWPCAPMPRTQSPHDLDNAAASRHRGRRPRRHPCGADAGSAWPAAGADRRGRARRRAGGRGGGWGARAGGGQGGGRVLIDEAARGGGQVSRRPPAHFQRPPRALYGSQAARATALHRTLDGLQAQIDYQSDSLVWNAEGGQLDLLHGPTQTTRTLRYGPLIVASGAIDRVLPVPGWTLPGVYTLGAAQVALKFQGCAIGRNVVLMGTGPLLYLVAYQYARCAGTRVAAVLDTARRADQLAAVPALLAEPAILARGLHCVAWLRAHGVPIHRGIRPVRVQGDARVRSVVWSDGAQQKSPARAAIR